jgi:hypothetical protein
VSASYGPASHHQEISGLLYDKKFTVWRWVQFDKQWTHVDAKPELR